MTNNPYNQDRVISLLAEIHAEIDNINKLIAEGHERLARYEAMKNRVYDLCTHRDPETDLVAYEVLSSGLNRCKICSQIIDFKEASIDNLADYVQHKYKQAS